MKISMYSVNNEKVVVELHSLGERVVENARKTMHASARRIVKEAQLNAPVDQHNLEKSIHIEKSYGERGRLEITVVAGGTVDGRDVDEYATIMHESIYALGPKSQEKQNAHPERIIGPKFLERAADKEEETLRSKMVAAIRRVIPK